MMEKLRTNEITWYEDSNLVEWWENDSIKPKNRKFDYYTLKESIEIAKMNKILLVIQPEFQDQCIMLDYSEGVTDD